MHGRKKSEYKAKLQDREISSKAAQKAQHYNALCDELIHRRRRLEDPSDVIQHNEKSLKLTEKLLSVNPDPNYLWNYRRDLLIENNDFFDVTLECRLTSFCLQRNPKAYAAWTHRKWAIRYWIKKGSCKESKTLLESEITLCSEFLCHDERNFHCWNYRRFIVAAIAFSLISENVFSSDYNQSNVNIDIDGSWGFASPSNSFSLIGPQIALEIDDSNSNYFNLITLEQRRSILETEWEFTLEKIRKNFSNYSAFHYRSIILPLILQTRIEDKNLACNDIYQIILALVKEELDLVQNAIFTEPDDQSSWWYHRFIVIWASPTSHSTLLKLPDESGNNNLMSYYLKVLEEQYDSIRELVDAEDGQCKWGLIALYTLFSLFLEHGNSEEVRNEFWKTEANDCMNKLIIIDPDRSSRYEDMKYCSTS